MTFWLLAYQGDTQLYKKPRFERHNMSENMQTRKICIIIRYEKEKPAQISRCLKRSIKLKGKTLRKQRNFSV